MVQGIGHCDIGGQPGTQSRSVVSQTVISGIMLTEVKANVLFFLNYLFHLFSILLQRVTVMTKL